MVDRRRFLALSGSALVMAACGRRSGGSAAVTTPRPGPTNALVTRWSSDPYARGAYSVLGLDARPEDRDDLRADVAARLFFAGEATSREYPATVHGALLEGRSAARRVERSLGGADGPPGGLSDGNSDEEPGGVIVIGAGAAGLAAARELSDNGYQVTVVEARNRTGGRVHTRNIGATPIDVGASWIHGVTDNPLSRLADASDVERYASNYDAVEVRGADRGQIANDELGRIERRVADAIAGAERSTTIGDALAPIREQLSAADQVLLDYVATVEIENELGVDAREATIEAFDDGEELSGGDALVPNGLKSVLAGLEGGYPLMIDAVVRRVRHDATGVQVTLDSDETLRADRAVITLPLGVLKSGDVEFVPPLPARNAAAIDRLDVGVLEKVALRFDEPFWDAGAEFLGRLPNGTSPIAEWINLLPLVGAPIVVGLVAGSAAERLAAATDQEIVEAAVEALGTS